MNFLLTDELKGQEFEGRSGVSQLKIDDGFFVWTVAQMIFNMNCNLFLDVLQVDFFPTSKFLDAVKTEHHADLERWILVAHMKLVAGIDFWPAVDYREMAGDCDGILLFADVDFEKDWL